MTSIMATTNNDDKLAQGFEEYRRACRERFQQNVSVPPTVKEESEDSVEECAAAIDSVDITDASIDTRIFSVTPAAPSCDIRASTGSIANEVRLNTSLDALKKKTQRRNSFDKVISFCSSVFSKKPDTPEVVREKEKLKAEREKEEQDFRMAAFIADLQMSGRSDEEIQMHLFHIRDQSQFQGARNNNSLGDMFRSMHQAFKDEFAARRNTVTVHVATENPFYAAPPAGYSNDLGYSYEDLVALEPVRRGVTNLDHLPVITYNGQDLKSNQTSCAICMAEFEMEENLRELPCSHHFHQDCVDRWLTVGTTCPVCKGEARCAEQ